MTRKPIFKCGTTQINLPSNAARKVTDYALTIPKLHLAGMGLDTGVPHITLRWGVLALEAKPLQDIVEEFLPFTVYFGKTGTFPPSLSSEMAGVVWVSVYSPILKQMHEAIGERIECSKYDFEYSPHATVAYIRPELRPLYEGLDILAGSDFVVDSIVFSDRFGDQTEIRKHYVEAKG